MAFKELHKNPHLSQEFLKKYPPPRIWLLLRHCPSSEHPFSDHCVNQCKLLPDNELQLCFLSWNLFYEKVKGSCFTIGSLWEELSRLLQAEVWGCVSSLHSSPQLTISQSLQMWSPAAGAWVNIGLHPSLVNGMDWFYSSWGLSTGGGQSDIRSLNWNGKWVSFRESYQAWENAFYFIYILFIVGREKIVHFSSSFMLSWSS